MIQMLSRILPQNPSFIAVGIKALGKTVFRAYKTSPRERGTIKLIGSQDIGQRQHGRIHGIILIRDLMVNSMQGCQQAHMGGKSPG